MWLAERLKERTTWLAIVAMAGLFGFTIKPELRDLIIDALIALSAIVAFVFRENERNVNIQLPPVELQSKSESDDGYISRDALRSELHRRNYPTEHDERQGWNG